MVKLEIVALGFLCIVAAVCATLIVPTLPDAHAAEPPVWSRVSVCAGRVVDASVFMAANDVLASKSQGLPREVAEQRLRSLATVIKGALQQCAEGKTPEWLPYPAAPSKPSPSKPDLPTQSI